jgi:hypothetical protein
LRFQTFEKILFLDETQFETKQLEISNFLWHLRLCKRLSFTGLLFPPTGRYKRSTRCVAHRTLKFSLCRNFGFPLKQIFIPAPDLQIFTSTFLVDSPFGVLLLQLNKCYLCSTTVTTCSVRSSFQ